MSPPLLPVETFCVQLPTFKGTQAILQNALTILDTLARNHRFLFFVGGALLWCYPVVFTWPVWPFKTASVYFLYLLGFEKGRVRKDSMASRHQSYYYGDHIPDYSTFAYLQSAGTYGAEADLEDAEASASVPIYARALGWVAGFLTVRSSFL